MSVDANTEASVVASSMNPWRRLLAMIGFGVLSYWLFVLLLLLVVAQFGFHLWSSIPNHRLGNLSRQITAYLNEIFTFLLYQTDTLPFPFEPLPAPGARADITNEDLSFGESPSWQACLRHLLGHVLEADDGELMNVRNALRRGKEEALARIGIRPWIRNGEAHIAFALRNPPLASIFLGTPWHGRAWGATLKRAPGAASGRIRLENDANPRHVLLLPLLLVLADDHR